VARLVLARRARRDLLELGWTLIDAIDNALSMLERDPVAGYALRGKLRGLSSLRVGSYRTIYQLTDGGKAVRVVAIRHRSISYGSDPR
jgi:mRNA-degrading endonuclease RelE of RelBE toxin-antitoxin system